jgi:curved DNA-binding protein CbpA
MGQTHSHTQGQNQGQNQANISQLYASYIQQQQNMIYQQQQQINSLYHHNLQTQQQMAPTMFFQQDTHQPQPQQQQQRQQQQRQPQQIPRLPAAPTQSLDPYRILGLPKTYTETQLKKAYLKLAMKTHPDRGGTPQQFQQVSIAYTVLTQKLKDRDSDKGHHELRSGAKEYIHTQETQSTHNIHMKDKFDAEVFNKIYEDNKIKDIYDSGYGSWMDQNPALTTGQTKMFQNGFNKDMFNATFEQYKQEQSKQNHQQLVRYHEPEQRLSLKNQDSLATLGQRKISDFSGTTDNLQYTDYKRAYTYGSTLIDPSSVSLEERAHSIGGVEEQRANLSYQLTPEDQQRLAVQQMKEQQEENKRIQRLQVYDQKHGQAYEKIHSLLLR